MIIKFTGYFLCTRSCFGSPILRKVLGSSRRNQIGHGTPKRCIQLQGEVPIKSMAHPVEHRTRHTFSSFSTDRAGAWLLLEIGGSLAIITCGLRC